MRLRPRQAVFVDRCCSALEQHGNTVGIAATGFGKTIALSAIAARHLERHGGKVLVLQHRDELLKQNARKFMKVAPDKRPSIYNAERKDWRGDVVFASEPTLRRADNREAMPAFGLAIIDECHHIAAPGYQGIVAALKERDDKVHLFGTTATIVRGDKASLKPTFTNIADVVGIKELVGTGHLVRPRVFVVDVGLEAALGSVRKVAGEYDQGAVAEIFNQPVVNDAVVRHWKEKAGDRKTMVFCSSVEHAHEMAAVFREAGVAADSVDGNLSLEERGRRLAAFERGETRVLTNVAILTEGYDHQPVSCVVYLKMSSYKSTFIQAVGRALRVVDPDLFPGVVKDDAIILDFGNTAKSIDTLDLDATLSDKVKPGDAPTKICPECGFVNRLGAEVCEECGYQFGAGEALAPPPEPIADFTMSELELLKRSSFLWVDLFNDDMALLATGFAAWAGVFWWSDHWHAVGGRSEEGQRREVKYLGCGQRMVAMALADDWLNEYENDDSAHKSKRWLKLPASEKQCSLLGIDPTFGSVPSRYNAACQLTFKFNRDRIHRLVMSRPLARAA